MSAAEHRIASEILSRVDCPFCHGRLHTDHKPDCPILVEAKRQHQEEAALASRLLAASSDQETTK